jgi:hypothetical protein
MEEGKVVPQKHADLRTEFTSGSCFATNDWRHLSLNQVDAAVRDAACLDVQQDALLTVWFANP